MFGGYTWVIKINLLIGLLSLNVYCSDHIGSDLAAFDLRLDDAWLFSQRAEKSFLACYPEGRYFGDNLLLTRLRSDDQHKKSLDNWGLFVFAKGLVGATYKDIDKEFVARFFTKRQDEEQAFFKTLWQSSASRLTLLRYGQVCYNLGTKDRVNRQLKAAKIAAKV